jgi:gliding motility-associated-like protein
MQYMNSFPLKFLAILLVLNTFVNSSFGITAKFTVSKRTNCAPAVVVFTNNSSQGTGVVYNWDFGLGVVSSFTDASPKEQLYTKAGQYKITLTVTDGPNTASTSTTITIFQGPTANFTTTPISGCPPLLVHYVSTSVPGDADIENTDWDFRNGDYGTGTFVQYSYNIPGLYDIILKVTDVNGCSSLIESDNLIHVVQKPSVNFTASDSFACTPPLNVTFVNRSSGASDLTYQWDFGNGKTSTGLGSSSIYYLNGKYTVTLKATDLSGCSDSLVKASYIKIGNPKANLLVYDVNNNRIDNSVLCDGIYQFVSTLRDLPDYTWEIRDNDKITIIAGQDSIVYRIRDSGTLVIKLIYGKNSSCTDSVVNSFAKGYAEAGFNLSDSLFCSLPQKINLQSISKNANHFSWYVSDQFISDRSDTAYSITKKDLAADPFQQTYSHEVIAYKVQVKLRVNNDGGCSDSIAKNITFSLPVARFMPDKVSGCVPLLVTFSDSSRSAYAIDKFRYDTGEDSIVTANRNTVQHTFTKPGEYYVSEIIKSGECYDTSYAIKIIAGDKLVPAIAVSPAEICNGGTIHTKGNTNNNSAVRVWRLRSEGLFDLSFNSPPDTSFAVFTDSTGFKEMDLQVDYNGCLSTVTKNDIFKIVGPAGNLAETFACDSPLIYHFKSEIAPATSLVWYIDTAVFKGTDTLQYKFPKSGDYSISLVAFDNFTNCTLRKSEFIKVRQIKAGFVMNDSIFCVGDSVHLDASSTFDNINTCYNEGFLWDFGDGSPPKRTFSNQYDHLYTSRGTDTLLLVAIAENGCSDSLAKTIHLNKPEGSFTTDKNSGCLPDLSVKFTNTSKDTSIVYWVWNFGDKSGDSTNKTAVTHDYISNTRQTYYASLAVYDAYQCYSNYSVPISLIGINCDFQADDNAICLGQTVSFFPSDTNLEALNWNFGDGSTSASGNNHTYNQPGVFSISLAGSGAGCSDTVIKPGYVTVEKGNANFTMSDSILYCYPDTLFFVHNNLTGSPAADRIWTFDSHVLSKMNSDSVKYVFTRPGKHTANLTIRTLNGCEESSSKNIQITGPTAIVSANPVKICFNDTVHFELDSLQDADRWEWLFGDGTTSNENPVSHRYALRGIIIPAVLLIKDQCSAVNILDTLLVSRAEADFNSTGSNQYICYGDTLDLINNSRYSNSWEWKTNDVTTSVNYNVNGIRFSEIGDYNIMLIAMDADHCSDTLLKKFTVVPNPVFSITGDSIMCLGTESVSLTVNQETGWNILWSPALGLSDPSAFSTVVRTNTTTVYKAEVTNSYGCTVSHEKKIYVNQPFHSTRYPLSDTSIYLGEQIQLVVLTDGDHVTCSWSPNFHISCLSCSNPFVAPTRDITYRVNLKNNCFDITESFNIGVIADFYLEAPSAFTPNGDSNNDVFKFEEEHIESFDLKIFNRWGEMVFSTQDVHEGWDGRVKGHTQNIDTYTYLVKAETIHGYRFEKRGELLLLK